ncbi:MAG: hypothetical protein IKR86_03795 [Candidatus Methanomethylophilaceae archaeon]|nr:hypothetical protein [Candidatus Methanomethylophilaceae archaeon]
MTIELTGRSRSLWGKISSENSSEWLPLYVHMSDSCRIGMRLWKEWVSESVKKHILENIQDMDPSNLIGFICSVHDIGKATPAFQTKRLKESNKED